MRSAQQGRRRRAGTPIDARQRLSGGGERLGDGWIGPTIEFDGEDERSVGAGTEALCDQVVGGAGGGAFGVVALVGEAESEAEDRHGQGEEQTRRRSVRRPRVGPAMVRLQR